MSLLEHPRAQELLDESYLDPATVRSCRKRLTTFVERYLPRFYRSEQRELASVVLNGKLSGLQRKTSEPIAIEAGRPRKPVQNFVGAGRWDDDAVLGELRRHVAEEIGDADGVLVIDPSGFAKKGTESCGVARQWCGRLGKVDNCQVGVFLTYASTKGHTLVDHQLYLTQAWAKDKKRRLKTHVPKKVKFQEKWRIALTMLERSGPALPHGWITADDEFGRPSAFRKALRDRQERYVLDVPCNTLVRPVDPRAGETRRFVRAEHWVAQQSARRWKKVTVRLGEKGPCQVKVLTRRVQTKDEDGVIGATETLVVIRTLAKNAETVYALSNAAREEREACLAQVQGMRHCVEEDLQLGKGEIGLSHYEVRSWVGWHHHMTLSLLALWFLQWEKERVKKKRQR